MRQDAFTELGPDEPPTSRNGHSKRVRKRKRRKRRRGSRVAGAVLLVLLLVAADGIYTAIGLESSLQEARTRLRAGARLLRDANVDRARAAFNEALAASQRARSLTRHPTFALAGILPVVSADPDAVRALADASYLTTLAGLEGSRALQAMGAQEQGIAPAIFSEGRVHFDAIEEARPYLEGAEGLARDASIVVDQAPAPHLDRIGTALSTARNELGDASDSARKATVLVESLPSLLAEGSERRYLLAFQALSEARGTGGVVGLHGELVARDGHLRLRSIGSYGDFGKLGPVESPADWFERRYEPFESLNQWPQANLSPHFPTVAKVLMDMYEQAAGRRLDGVVAMDPVAMARLTEATGPLKSPQLGTVGPANAVEVLGRDSYLETEDQATQNAALAGIVQQFWDRVASGEVDAPAFASALSDAVTSRHLQAYAAGPDDRNALEELETDGSFAGLGDNIQLVFHNNVTVNKVDYFLERSIDTRIELTERGQARVTTTVTLGNNAPKGPPSLLLGPGIAGDPVGLNRMYLNFVLPRAAKIMGLTIDGRKTSPLRGTEAGYPVAWEVVEIPAGETSEVRIAYVIEKAFDPDDESSFSLSLVPHPGVTEDPLSVSITPPAGFAYEGGQAALESSGALDRTKRIEVKLTPH